MIRHPAKFTDTILPVIASMLKPGSLVLDPFAGTGKIHRLRPAFRTVGVELEPEWAEQSPFTIVGSALRLPFANATFDAVATSPVYGNRMSDHHEARDASRRNTYRHALGRPLHPDNAGQLHWGPTYKTFHRQAWAEVLRVLKPEGTFVLNVSDFLKTEKKGEAPVIQRVTDWHVTQLVGAFGLQVVAREHVPTPRNKHGANGATRVGHESVIAFGRRNV